MRSIHRRLTGLLLCLVLIAAVLPTTLADSIAAGDDATAETEEVSPDLKNEPAPELVPGLDEDEFSDDPIPDDNPIPDDDPIPDFVPGVVEEDTDFTYPAYTPQRNTTRSSLPSYYDGREEGYLTPVGNQGSSGICWIFGGVAALEANMVKTGVASVGTLDLSEQHVAYATSISGGNSKQGMRDGPNDGGNRSMISAYMMRGTDGLFGMVNESDDPFDGKLLQERDVSITQAKRKSYTVQNIGYISGKAKPKTTEEFNAIKQAVYNYGAVSASMYINNNYLRTYTYSYYCPTETSGNHEVTIVGWDDDYSKG